jgi:hypothetical protein
MKKHVDSWQLTDVEQKKLLVEWLKSSVKNPQMLINRLLEECKYKK